MSEQKKYLQVLDVMENGDVHVRVWPLTEEEFDRMNLGDPPWEMICPADQVLDVANFAEDRAIVRGSLLPEEEDD